MGEAIAVLEQLLVDVLGELGMRGEAGRLGVESEVAGRAATPREVSRDLVEALSVRGLLNQDFFQRLIMGRTGEPAERVRACAKQFDVELPAAWGAPGLGPGAVNEGGTSLRPVRIAAGAAGAQVLVGTGELIAPDLVLTARHVGKDRVVLWAGLPDGELVEVVNTLGPASSLDVVLLRLGAPLVGPGAGFLPLAHRVPAAASAWSAFGYPVVDPAHPQEGLQSIGGTTQARHASQPILTLTASVANEAGAKGWAGLSGAGVQVGAELVAVVTEVWQGGWEQRVVHAIPLADFVRQLWFVAARGSRTVEEVQRELDLVRREIEKMLTGSPDVARELAKRLGRADAEPAALAAQVMDCRAEQLRKAFNLAHRQLRSNASARVLVELRRLLCVLLPYLYDFRPIVSGAATQGAHTLPVRTELLAEVVMAGACGRPCAFVRVGDSPRLRGEAQLSLLAETSASLILEPGRLLQSIVRALAKDLRVEAADDGERLKRVRKRLTDNLELWSDLRKDGEAWSQSPSRHELPRYLLVIDADHQDVAGQDGVDSQRRFVEAQEWYELLVAAVASVSPPLPLPVLRLVGDDPDAIEFSFDDTFHVLFSGDSKEA